jgi:hypothetical protein
MEADHDHGYPSIEAILLNEGGILAGHQDRPSLAAHCF